MDYKEWEKKHTISIDIPVQLFIRMTKKPKEILERALLIAKADDGKEFTFQSRCPLDGGTEDLIICEMAQEENDIK